MKILAVGAHFDDIEIGCGGTLLKHIENGDEIYMAITSSDEFRTGKPEKRYVEQLESLKCMGIKAKRIYNFSYLDEVHNIIGDLDKLSPYFIFTQYEFDTHQDHRRASIVGQAVGRKRNMTTLFYDSGSAYNFHPNVYSFIDWNNKIQLLNCYKSQLEYGAINIDILKKKDLYWGSLTTSVKDSYAEGFVVRKMRWII